MTWFSLRRIFPLGSGMYEERVTIWQPASADEAIALAESEANEHADGIGRYISSAQSFEMFHEPAAGAEVFSLIRSSELAERSSIRDSSTFARHDCRS